MCGSGCPRLLVVLLVLFPPLIALGQTDRSNGTSSFVKPSIASGASAQPALPISPPIIQRQPIPLPRPSPTPPFGLPQLVHAAGTIFSGTVMAISHPASHGAQIETVTITFRVEQAIRGAVPGENLAVTQWMGLWSSGQRYRIGERVLVFLYPRSKLGLTSLVGGGFGRFAVDGQDQVLLTAQHIGAFRKDAALGGKSRVRIGDFAGAVHRASEEESAP
jgi:hypothetical protein